MEKFKPLFDNFLMAPNYENLKKFHTHLENIENSHLHMYQTYILLPLVIKIDDLALKNNKELVVELINTIINIIKRIKIKDINGLKTIVIVNLKQIYDFESGAVIVNSSEELKLAVIQCITMSLRNCYTDVLTIFYTITHSSIIGTIAAACVHLIEKEKYKTLRIASVNCLDALFYIHENADSNDVVLRVQIADITFVFLPKIAKVLYECAMNDDKIGLNLISSSIRVLGGIFYVIYEDINTNNNKSYEISDFVKLVESSKTKNSSEDNIANINNLTKGNYFSEENLDNLLKNGRTSEWFRSSSKILFPLFVKLSKLRSNKTEVVRLNYTKMCCRLAQKCSQNLQPENFQLFLESIIALSQDTNYNIKKLCKYSIRDLRKSVGDIKMINFITNLFEIHLTKLPRIIERADEIDQISEFLFLKGFFKNLPEENLEKIFINPGNVEKCLYNLISAFDLELHQDLLREEYALKTIGENAEITTLPWRKYKKIASERAINHLIDLCKIFGQLSIVQYFVDYLMELIKQNSLVSNECILILTYMLTQEGVDNKYVIQLLEEILDEKHWHLSLEPNNMKRLKIEKESNWYIDRTPGLYESAIEVRIQDINMDDDTESASEDTINLMDVKFNILHTCLILDAIGHISVQLEDNYRPFVFRSLHHILLKTGSSKYVVHKSGSFALNCIKTGLKYEKISELIQHYSDYISYQLHVSLKKNQQCELAIDILTIVLGYSSLNSLGYLENIISTIVEDLSKEHKAPNISSYLRVCCVFLLNVEKWCFEKQKLVDKEIPEDTCIEVQSFIEKLINNIKKTDDYEELTDFNNPAKVLESEDDANFDEKKNEDIQNNKESENQKSDKLELPAFINLVLKILKVIFKLISSKNQTHQILSLECLAVGLPILTDYEDEILPLVHTVWYPLVERFTDKDPVVLNRCFILLEVLAKCSKDFLLKSTLNNVLPFLNKFLRLSSTNSLQEINLCETQEFKLQCKLLDNYPSLIVNMNIRQKYLDDILDSIILYLNKKQPKLLQEKCIKNLIELSNFNKPLIYLKLLNQFNDVNFHENVKYIFDQIKINFT